MALKGSFSSSGISGPCQGQERPIAVKGFFFIVFLALRIRFKILKVLKDHNLLGKMSVTEIIFELSMMGRIAEKSGEKYFAAVPKKVEKIVDLFKDMIPMG